MESPFDFNFDTADTREMHPGLRRVVEAEQLRRAQEQEARVRTAVQQIIWEELVSVLEDAKTAQDNDIDVVDYVASCMRSRIDAAAEKAREGR